VAVHLTDQRLPLGDILTKYDTQGTGMLYKSDFTTLFLDNYLSLGGTLQANGTLQGLSLPLKHLLATRYCPVPSQLSFRYEAFIEDMRRKELEGKGAIRIYMSQADVQMDETVGEDPSFAK
jgi:hypothetical protein